MVNKKSLIICLTLVFSLIIMSYLVNAAVATATLKAPATTTYHSGTMPVSCETTVTDVTNCTIIYGLSGGTNYTIYIANTSGDQTNFSNTAADISSRTDSSSYIFTCVMQNAANTTYSAGVSSVTIDNTNPGVIVTRHGLYHVEQQAFSQVECTYTDSIDNSLTVTRSLAKPVSGDTVTTTEDLHTFANGDFDELGVYTYTCTATDDSGNSDSDTAEFKVVPVESAGSTKTTVSKATALLKGDNSTLIIAAGIVVVILMIAVGGGVATVKGKKRKRR